MHPPLPSREDEKTTWRERLSSFRNILPLLKMVWETNPPLVMVSVVLRFVRALLPVATLWVGKLILDAVVSRMAGKTTDSSAIWHWVGIELALAVANDALGRGNAL